MKYKKGDNVKIVNGFKPSNFKAGEKVVVVMADPCSEILRYFVENAEGVGCWVNELEIRTHE